MRYHNKATRIVTIKKTDIIKCWQECKETGTLIPCYICKNQHSTVTWEKNPAVCHKVEQVLPNDTAQSNQWPLFYPQFSSWMNLKITVLSKSHQT